MLTQPKTIYRSLPPRLSVLVSLLLVVSACEQYEIVIEDLSQSDANTALVLLRQKHIDAQKIGHSARKSTTYQIKVKKTDADEALRLLVYNRIPKTERASLKEVYPPGSSGLIPTKSDELARLMMAMQGEIEGLLKVVPGIADARVVISFDQPSEINRANPKKASVAIIYRPNEETHASPMSDWEIKNLVATSLSGMLADDVTVVQKPIKPEGYVDASSNPTPLADTAVKEPKKDSSMVLFGVTAFALLIAAYSAFRLFWQRRLAVTAP